MEYRRLLSLAAVAISHANLKINLQYSTTYSYVVPRYNNNNYDDGESN